MLGILVNLHCDPRKLAGIKPLADEKIKPQRDSVAKVPGRRGEKRGEERNTLQKNDNGQGRRNKKINKERFSHHIFILEHPREN